MKILSYPDKVLGLIGAFVVISLLFATYMMFHDAIFLLPVLIGWMFFSIYLIRKNYIEITLKPDRFELSNMGKKSVLLFSEIAYIEETRNNNNPMAYRKYVIILKEQVGIKKPSLTIVNPNFTKWLSKNEQSFVIKKLMTID